jgi:hypothetical protein
MELLNDGLNGIKELDLALYRLESPNSIQEHSWVAVLKTLCVIVPVIFWSVIIICSYDWWLSNKSIHLLQHPVIISHVTTICDSMLPSIRCAWGMQFASYVHVLVAWDELLHHQCKVRTLHFCSSSCVGVFLGNVVDWWVRDWKWSSCKIFIEKAEQKSPLGRLKCRFEDNVKMNLKEIWWKDMY